MSIFSLFSVLFPILLLAHSCQSGGGGTETPLPNEFPSGQRASLPVQPAAAGSEGVVDEIRYHTERGTPQSLFNAMDIIRRLELGSTDFGRVMNAVNVTLFQTLYPAIRAQLPAKDPPLVHSYSQILRDIENGVYTAPAPNSADFLEHVLPFLSLYSPPRGMIFLSEDYLSKLPDLERAAILNRESVLPHYFTGIVYERSGRLADALRQYNSTWERFPEAYPAALGIARVMEEQGRPREAINFLSALVGRFPDNLHIRRILALAHYQAGDWAQAAARAREILNEDTQDGELILILAHSLIEQGQLLEAQTHLERYSGINPNNRLYLFLLARVQAEAHNNRDAALNSLRTIIRITPTDRYLTDRYPSDRFTAADEDLLLSASMYAARLLLESPRAADQAEGRTLLAGLLDVPRPSLELVSLALEDMVRQEAWAAARAYLPRLLSERRSRGDLQAAYAVERGLGNNAAAFAHAQELFNRDRQNEEGRLIYISALIDTGRRDEAAAMIEISLDAVPPGEIRSQYFFQRSRLADNETTAISDLQSSLFENPRNLQALIAMFEIFHRQGDERRALFYLRQALALAPDNLRLRAYQSEYAAVNTL